jgi:hypothetical protein
MSLPQSTINDILAYKFNGNVYLKTWEGYYIAFTNGQGILETNARYYYSSEPGASWKLGISPSGSYCFTGTYLAGGYPKPFWLQCNMKGGHEIIPWAGGCGNWESFWIESNGDGFAFKNMGSQQYLSAQPHDFHGFMLLANRGAAAQWEKFFIELH